MKLTTTQTTVLKMVYDAGTTTAFKIHFSNANQYLIPLETKGLIIRKWVSHKGKPHKEARINPNKINLVRKLLGLKV